MNTRPLRWMIVLVATAIALPAYAMYKVVGPDGKVTYTDVPPTTVGSRVVPMGGRTAPVPEVSLPLDLRQAVSRYPVTLYTATNCAPCDMGRRWLRERGVPFSEKTVTSSEDVESFTRLTGGAELPALAVGPQMMKGMSQDQWASFVDAAGYPRGSQLPANYQYPSATPLVERKEPPPRAATTPQPQPVAEPAPNPGGIRF
jgi:glutaredoxin